MSEQSFGERLICIASLVRRGAYLADIGCDHAYLSIYLLGGGKIERAALADINEGPLNRAKENIESYNFSEKVSFHLCDGAEGLSELGITDYAICGMGGELIVRIIENSPHLHKENVRLILQPMTKQEILRKYLYENGFFIEDERYCKEDGKVYVCIAASFCGESYNASFEEKYFGEKKFSDNKKLSLKEKTALIQYLETKIRSLSAAAEGKRSAGIFASEEELLLKEAEKRLKSFG